MTLKLKGKYAKFTPLVFLTNFVYAYNSVLKKKSAYTLDEFKKPKILNDYIEKIIKTALKEYNLEMKENQRVIKMGNSQLIKLCFDYYQ